MSRFLLQPSRLLQTRLVDDKNQEAIDLTFDQLVKKLVPNKDVNEAIKLGRLKPGSFVGLVHSARFPEKVVIFVLHNEDRTGELSYVLKRDPSFETRLIQAWRVAECSYDRKVTEFSVAS